MLESIGPRADEAFDATYAPDRVLTDGETIDIDGKALTAVATPGHTSNHLCFAYGDALFSGDHVMGWSTTVVFPPDGDMGAYMASLEKLRHREERIFYPAHGPAVTKPQQYLRGLIGHRMQREKQIIRLIGSTPLAVPADRCRRLSRARSAAGHRGRRVGPGASPGPRAARAR